MFTGVQRIGGCHALALAAIIPCGLLAKHAWDIYTRIKLVQKRRVVTAGSLSETFKQSHTLAALVNPRRHVSIADVLVMDLDLPEHAEDLSDEVLLATFVHGFFAGKVLAIEKYLLQTARLTLVSYAGLKSISASNQIWKSHNLSCEKLPPLHSVVFGAFQVSYVKLVNPQESHAGPETESSVDFVFGKDKSQFAGAHRFSIVRKSGDSTRVRVVYESTACNPTRNQPVSDLLHQFHKIYMMLLFREGVSEVMQRLERSIGDGCQ
ncbi:hypothetical protein CORC01_05220 [Colletotrichum orchidophilum]|uniref:Uncharacterized protein n=1 Tax=Colletotrichum orchidophilum TaxID=1209926 RepID=A0A1G4BDG4_9PEZI|nr:uncharacterized protein CORC01_05220 [Colletotrichum orchidophilum]OHE99420.1 hypothetical protein CORC01_05220 [Colletotrichum orchidophilum]